MKTVIISDRYRVNIGSDARNHTLEKLVDGGVNPKTKEPAAPRWVVDGYFRDMAHCLSKVIELESAQGEQTRTLEQHLADVRCLIEWAKTVGKEIDCE